jgi:hypothetical protein
MNQKATAAITTTDPAKAIRRPQARFANRLVTFSVTVTVTHAHAGRAVIVRRDSCGRRVAGQSSLHARRTECSGGHDGDMDEH